jgi:hypothetical protein
MSNRGTKLIELDRTEIFTQVCLWLKITSAAGAENRLAMESCTHRALQAAQKYSLVANPIKSQISIEPEIAITL